MSTAIRIYTSRRCAYCLMAKRLLQKHGVPYDEVDVTADPIKRRWLRELTGRHTVPQIFIAGRTIGGYRELAELAKLRGLTPRSDSGAPAQTAPSGRPLKSSIALRLSLAAILAVLGVWLW